MMIVGKTIEVVMMTFIDGDAEGKIVFSDERRANDFVKKLRRVDNQAYKVKGNFSKKIGFFIRGIPRIEEVSNDLIISAMNEQYGEGAIEVMGIKSSTKHGKRMDFGVAQVRVDMNVAVGMKNKNFKFKMEDRRYMGTWTLDRFVKFCSKCKSYGHNAHQKKMCKGSKCKFGCCEVSDENEHCVKEIKKCYHCNGNHEAGDWRCSERKKIQQNQQAAVEKAINDACTAALR